MSPSSAVSEPIGAAVDEIDVVDVVDVVRRAGRPRSAQADVAILDAATEEFIDHGLDGMSVDDVAARARVSKATIYRRYNRKLDLVVAAARRACEERAPLASTGDIRRDLRALGRSLLDMLHGTAAGRAIPRMVAESAAHPELRDAYHAFIAQRRAQALTLVSDAVTRGELRPDCDPRVVVDTISGPVFYRYLLSGDPCDDPYVDELVDDVLRAFST